MQYSLQHYNYAIGAWCMTAVLCMAAPVRAGAEEQAGDNASTPGQASAGAGAQPAQPGEPGNMARDNNDLQAWEAQSLEPASGDVFMAEPDYNIATQLSPAGMTASGGQVTTSATGQNFSSIARNINSSVDEIPGLISGLSYLLGSLLGVMGILKVKDHVENPQQTELKQGAIRLAAGGGLFALPIVYEAMHNTIGDVSSTVGPPSLNRAEFSVR